MGVAQKVAVGIALLVAALGIAVAATAWLLSWAFAVGIWAGGLCIALAAAVLVPVRTGDLRSVANPAADFGESLDRFRAKMAKDTGRLNPLCVPELLHHGKKTGTAVILIHGISSCPRAFVDFAPLLHGRGHNVLVVRMPCNGLKDRATDALNDLTAEKLVRFGDEAVDLACGLGDEVIVCGISAGGVVAAWIGQTRRDVARAVLIAPFFGLPGIGTTLNLLVMRIMLFLPAISIWKDPIKREKFEGMPHAYKRQSTRGTGEVLRLGYAAAQQAARARPAARSGVLVLNDNDAAINNDIAVAFGNRWERHGCPLVQYRFSKDHGLGHEIIDPMEPGADTAVTYPVLIDLIEGREA